MLTAPTALPDSAVAAQLRAGWGVSVTHIEYRAVGFGSHHWTATDTEGRRWFVTVDELDGEAAFDALHAALATVIEIRAAGATFAVAPLPTRAGDPLLRIDPAHAIACYPHVEGDSFAWDDLTSDTRDALLQLVIALHATPVTDAPSAGVDTLTLAHRDHLEGALDDRFDEHNGPYAACTRELVRTHRVELRALLVRHDALTAELQRRTRRVVLTHGEPHPGNMMRTPDGWVLVDWDTARLAPPERDLWALDPGDGSVHAAYERATARVLDPDWLAYYRTRWDLVDIGVYLARFHAPHADTADDAKSWEELQELVTGASA